MKLSYLFFSFPLEFQRLKRLAWNLGVSSVVGGMGVALAPFLWNLGVSSVVDGMGVALAAFLSGLNKLCISVLSVELTCGAVLIAFEMVLITAGEPRMFRKIPIASSMLFLMSVNWETSAMVSVRNETAVEKQERQNWERPLGTAAFFMFQNNYLEN